MNIAAIRKIYELGADIHAPYPSPNAPTGYKVTPIIMAAQIGNIEAIKILHELGADVNTPSDNTPPFDLNPIHAAATSGMTDAIKTEVPPKIRNSLV